MTAAPEFSRPVRLDTLGSAGQPLSLEASEAERQALARRFGLVAIARLTAELALTRTGDAVRAEGRLSGAVTQSCVATGAPVEAVVEEKFEILFQPQPTGLAEEEEEIELSGAEMDVIFYDGAAIDVGEAVAETLSLALDPYPRVPDAEAVLRAAGVKSEADAGTGAFAGLKDLLKP